ncbi:hypothetical protein ACJX0J_040728, partial [Zea mays]
MGKKRLKQKNMASNFKDVVYRLFAQKTFNIQEEISEKPGLNSQLDVILKDLNIDFGNHL